MNNASNRFKRGSITTDAQSVHSRTSAVAAISPTKKPKSVKSTEVKVPVRFNPEVEPSPEFKDFYPLHVTKVTQNSPLGMFVFIIVAIVIIILAAVAGTYVVKRQQNNSTKSSTATSSTVATDLTGGVAGALSPDLGTIVANSDGTHMYKNTTYGFQLTIPESWKNVSVQMSDQDALKSTTKAATVLQFVLDDATAQSPVILELRVDSASSYPAWQAALQKANIAVPPKLFDASFIVSEDYAVNESAVPAGDTVMTAAVHDIVTVVSSIKAIAS